MTSLTRPLALALASAILVPTVASAASSLEALYQVRLRGIPVGTATFQVDSDDNRYSVQASMRTNGLVRIISKAEAAGAASGTIDGKRLIPAHHTYRWSEKGEDEALDIRFRGHKVADVTIDPAPKPRKNTVPVTDDHKTDVLDPLSALVFPGDISDSKALCDRTLPVFDGRQRYDLKLGFSRTETLGADQGWDTPGKAVVCSIRYVPVAGHRPGRASVRFMEENKELEVWMASVGDSGLVAPVQARFRTRSGVVTLEGRRFAVNSPAAPQP